MHQTQRLRFPGAHAGWVMVAMLALAGLGEAPRATTFYVNGATGDNSGNGLSPATAWKTIQKAANTMPAGSTCIVAPGHYAERVYVSRSGAPGAPLRFAAGGPGTVLMGFSVGRKNGAISHVQIEGFEITMARLPLLDTWDIGSGIALVDTRYCEVRRCYIHHTLREGIMVYTFGGEDSPDSSHNRLVDNTIAYAGAYAGITLNGAAQHVEGNDISHTVQHPLYPTPSTADGADADGIQFFGRDHVFRGNRIHDITRGDVGNVNPHIDAFQTYGPAYNTVIEGNDINLPTNANASQAAMISQARTPTRDLTLRYNVVTAFRGFNVWGENDFTGQVVPLPRVIVANNTFYGVRDYDIELHDCPQSVVKNNAISATGRYMSTNSSPDVSSNAVPESLAPYPHDKPVANPLFMNPARRDFELQPDSPLIDAGVSLGYTADYRGTSVPRGAFPDIGAFEFVDPADLGMLSYPFFSDCLDILLRDCLLFQHGLRSAG